ncbi:DUF302 domain-containing protein [Porphyromonadaceae sp. NP-X]|jgi:uncharacterized protein (DUF302 family)|nr:DUF302 domain-containing protein [Porphyromonadaceae sp. NP-X]NLJ19529.1 DUF302 domain-containing protein [Bacteroidales bacterium]VBB45789.1 conserved hypothetical protein [uncultured Paludibacter sp.]
MEYYFSKTLNVSFDEAIKITTEALKSEGFGVISEIRMHEKLKEKLDIDFKKYTILGACNPPFAYKALQAEDKIGTMLPCNVLVIEQAENEIEVAAVNPIASMQAIVNPALGEVAQQVTDKLKKVIVDL